MSTIFTVAVIVGSLRKDSLNRKMARALTELAPPALRFEFVELGGLPLYNQDLDDEGTPPAAWADFRKAIKGVDAVLFLTPEYNRSMPATIPASISQCDRFFVCVKIRSTLPCA